MPQSGLWRKMQRFGGPERPAEIRDGPIATNDPGTDIVSKVP